MFQALTHNPVCRALGCNYPIIQSAMGWIATPQLVAAVSNAGGFGMLAAAVLSVEEADQNIREVKRLTDKPFGVNFHSFQPDADAIVSLMVKHQVAAASYGRTPSSQLIAQLKEAGIICMPTVGALRHATKAEAMGADVIVVQGSEGGGHTGAIASTVLLPQVLDVVNIPVLASGGFWDGRGLAAAFMFGASGVSMGTRFLLTQESPAPDRVKQRYIKALPDEIVITKKIDGLPHRVIMNRFAKKLESTAVIARLLRAMVYAYIYRKQSGASFLQLLKSARLMLREGDMNLAVALMAANAPVLIRRAMIDGDAEGGVLPSGQIAGIIKDIPTCQILIERMIEEAEHALNTTMGSARIKEMVKA